MDLGLRNIRSLAGDWPAQFAAAQKVGAAYLQVDGVPDEDAETVAGLIEESGVGVWSVTALSTDLLGPDMDASARQQENVRAAVERAVELGAPCVTVFAGRDRSKSLDDNLAVFGQVFGELADYAAERDVTLVLENCPMTGGQPPAPRNLAYCPAHWEAMFKAVPSDGLGLELDFGHLPGLGIDAVRAVHDFGSRIRHVGMKDAHVDPEAVYRNGWIGPGIKEHRAPGEGDIPWRQVIGALREVGYDGPLTMEHIHPPTDSVELYMRIAGFLRSIAG